MTTIEEEQNEEKDTNRNLMLKLAICNMCYINEYTCAFKDTTIREHTIQKKVKK